MIKLYKSHSKNLVVNLVSKNIVIKTVFFLTSILFTNASIAQGPVQAGTVTSTNAIFQVAYNYQNNICDGDTKGTITINTINTNNFAGYTFKWLDNISELTNKRVGLSFQVYEVEITEITNPTNKDNVKITIISPFAIQIGTGSLIKPKCTGGIDGETNVTNISGGTPFTTGDPYKYSWTKKNTTTPIIATTKNFIGAPGSYTLKVTDANGCKQFLLQYDIEDAPVYIVNSIIKVDNVEFGQMNGKITLDISGGTPNPAPNPYTYEWYLNDVLIPSFSGPTQSNLASGKYKIIVKDANNCPKTILVDILPLALLKIDPTSINSTCKSTPNGSINLNVTGGEAPYSIKWADLPNPTALTTRTGLDKGTYSAILTDALGATRNIDPIVIDAPELLVFPPVSSTNNKCFLDNNGTITVNNVNGGIAPYSYVLNGGTPVTFTGNSVVIPSLTSGSYTVAIKDNGGCTNAPSQNVDILPLKALGYLKAPLINQVTCTDDKSGAINVFIEGGQTPYQYKWSNDANLNSADNPNLQEDNYTLQVTDALGCSFNPPAILVTRNSQAVSLTRGPQKNNVCYNDNNGSATFTLSGGTPNYTANWTYGGKSTNLTDIDPSQNKITVNNLPSGKYTLMITDQKGCISTTLIIDITPFKLLTNPIITPISCNGKNNATIEVTPSGGVPGYNYFWTSVQFSAPVTTKKIGPLAPGSYTLQVIDSKGCILPDTTFIISNAIPITSVESIYEKANVCIADSANGSARIKVKGGVPPYTSFQFSVIDPSTGLPVALAPTVIDLNFPDVAINNTLFPGTYILTVTDQNLCPSVLPPFVIERNNCDPGNDKIIVDPLMSPNGDGLGNEFFYINKIEDYPENEVIIYNRWGMEVFTIRGYDNKDRVFRGIANSALTNRNEVLVDGVYYYTIRSVMDKKQKVNKGYLIIKR